MNGLVRLVAVLLVVSGVLGLVYGGFSYLPHEATLGPAEVSVKSGGTVDVPVWAGALAIGTGGLLLLLGRNRSC